MMRLCEGLNKFIRIEAKVAKSNVIIGIYDDKEGRSARSNRK